MRISHLLVAGLALLTISLGLSPASAIEALGPYLLEGEDWPWKARIDGDSYVVENLPENGGENSAERDNSVRYFFVQSDGDGDRAYSVEVNLERFSDMAGAGLLYGLSDDPYTYFALVIVPDRTVKLLKRDGDGLRQLMSVSGDRIGPGWNRVSIVEGGGKFEARVNGNTVAEIEPGGVVGDRVGIWVAGMGRFRFRDFTAATATVVAPPLPGEVPPVADAEPAPLPQIPLPGQVPGEQVEGGTPTPLPAPADGGTVAPAPDMPDQRIAEDDRTGVAGIREMLAFARQSTTARLNRQQGAGNDASAPPPGWQRYVDRSSGLVTMNYPADWTLQPLVKAGYSAGGQPQGPNPQQPNVGPQGGMVVSFADLRLTSPDGYHMVQGVTYYRDGWVEAEEYAREVAFGEASIVADFQIVHNDTWLVERRPMLIDVSFMALESDEYIAIIIGATSTVASGGMAATQVGHRLLIGPKVTFTQMTRSTYIPILESTIGW